MVAVRPVTCRKCAAGSFFQDGPAAVGLSSHCACRACGNGTFVPEAGVKDSGKCQRCPLGTDPLLRAGYRACPCLPGYFRRSRFGPCESCAGETGIECANDTRILQPGYWWTFSGNESRARYRSFVQQLAIEDAGALTDLNGSVPSAYKCLSDAACLGGQESDCSTGYTGVLCSECTAGHYEWFGVCKT